MKILILFCFILLISSPIFAANANTLSQPIPYLGEMASACCALFWAFSTILFRVSGDHINPVSLNLFKNILAFILFFITLILLTLTIIPNNLGLSFFPENINFGDYVILLISGYLGLAIADSFYFAALNRIGAGYSAIVDCSYSFFMVLGSYFYLGEPLSLKTFFALFLIVTAIFIGTWTPPNKIPTVSKISRHDFYMGVMLGTLSMLFVSIAIIIANPVLKKSDPIWANTIRMLGGIIPLVCLGFAPWHRKMMYEFLYKTQALKSAIPACVLGNYLAMIAWITGMKYTLASTAGILNQLSTIFILCLATVFLKEHLTWRKAIAIAMGFAGGVIISL